VDVSAVLFVVLYILQLFCLFLYSSFFFYLV